MTVKIIAVDMDGTFLNEDISSLRKVPSISTAIILTVIYTSGFVFVHPIMHTKDCGFVKKIRLKANIF